MRLSIGENWKTTTIVAIEFKNDTKRVISLKQCIKNCQSASKKYDFNPTKQVPVYHTDAYRPTSSPELANHL